MLRPRWLRTIRHRLSSESATTGPSGSTLYDRTTRPSRRYKGYPPRSPSLPRQEHGAGRHLGQSLEGGTHDHIAFGLAARDSTRPCRTVGRGAKGPLVAASSDAERRSRGERLGGRWAIVQGRQSADA